MKTRYSLAFVAIIVLLSIVALSCTKENLVDPPKVILSTDWGNRTEGVAIPSEYTVVLNNKALTYYNIANTLPESDAGAYFLLIYNTAESVSLNGTLATVATENGVVDPSPGWLFSSILNLEFENDKEKTVTAVMQQQVRLLNIELTVMNGDINNIESISASLSGVANTMNLKEGTYSGTGLKVEPIFTKGDNKLIASVRLIGLTSEGQTLTLNLNYIGGAQQQIISDVSNMLTGFDIEKHKPIILTGNASIISGVTFDTTISGWVSQGNITGEANEQ